MPEKTHLDENQASPDQPSQKSMTAGQLLKQARLKAGVHLAVLSVTLKVPVRQLEALEADQYLIHQSPVFARGLASSVCRQLRIDPAPVLALLPQTSSYSESFTPSRHVDVAPAELGFMRPSSERFPVKALWAALAMALLIAGLIWLPGPSQWVWLTNLTSAFKTPDSTSPVSASDSATVVVPSVPSASEASSLGGVSIVPSEPLSPAAPQSPASSSISDTLSRGAAVVLSESGKEALNSTKLGSYEWVFTATAETWLEVRDSQNQVLWSGVLKPGESSRLQVPLPVSIVVGRADAMQVSFKGQAFDLKPHSKMNVARFEVKP